MTSSTERRVDVRFGMGTAAAMIISWTTWHSFWWMILHGVFGYFYVIYFFLIKNYDQLHTVLQ